MDITIINAMDKLRLTLQTDEDYRYGWQANIAMAFKDQWATAGFSVPDPQFIHDMANNAAKAFLEQLAPMREMPDLPGSLSVALTHNLPTP